MDPESLGITGAPVPASSEVELESSSKVSLYNKRFIDSLSRTEQEKIIAALLASTPHLQQPIDPETVGKMVDLKMAQIGAKMWDDFNNALREQADRIIKEISSPAYQAWAQLHDPIVLAKAEAKKPIEAMSALRSSTEFNTWVNSLPVEAREKELHFNRVLENTGSLINGVNQYYKSSKDDADAVPFIAAALTVAAGIAGSIVSVPSIENVAASFSQVIPSAIIDPTTMTINLFAMGLMYTATAETIGKAMEAGKKPQTMQFALNFAEQVLNKVRGNQINQFLLATLMNKYVDGKPITPDRADQYSTMAKIIMLGLALGAIYKSAVAWITDKDFAGILQNPNFKEGSIAPEVQDAIKRLVAAVHANLKSLNPKDGTNMLAALMDYFASNPSFDSLFDPLHAYTKVLDEIPPHPDLA